MEKHEKQLELFYLARRASERMPVDYLNNEMKTEVNAKKLPETTEELRSNVERFIQALVEFPERVMSLFHNPKVEYASTPM